MCPVAREVNADETSVPLAPAATWSQTDERMKKRCRMTGGEATCGGEEEGIKKIRCVFQSPPPEKFPPLCENRTMCASCHLDADEGPQTEGHRMTHETGDTWRRTKDIFLRNGHFYET